MTALGWTFLIASLAFVWGLTGYCYYRIFAAPPEGDSGSKPAS